MRGLSGMATLLSRTKFPPGGFQVLIPEAGMKTPVSGGFQEMVEWLVRFARSNPGLTERLKLPTTKAGGEAWVDDYNARRCVAGGWLNFVNISSAAPLAVAEAQKKTSLGSAVGGVVRKGRAAASAYLSMFGATGPVDKALAASRAAVCSACPQNDIKGGLWDYVAKAAADDIMAILGALKDMDLTTPHHASLGVCRACSCPMKAKVFTALSVIESKMPAESWPLLPRNNPRCWILAESARP